MNKKVFEYCGFFLLIFFYMGVFISKPLMNLTFGVALLCSIFYIFIFNKKIIKQKKFLLLIIVPFLSGIILSLFSERFISGPPMFINRHKFMLLFIPLALFADSKKKYSILIAAATFSGLFAICYGIYSGKMSYGTFTGPLKIGRTADMMMMLSLTMASYFFSLYSKNKLLKIVLFVLFCIFTYAMVLSGIRGGFLGFLFGLFVLLLITNKKRIAFSIIIFLIIGIFSFSGFKNDLTSIIDTKNNTSNSTRIQLLKTGLEYIYSGNYILFGVGAENSEKTFKAFILSQDEAYQQNNKFAFDHLRDFHNSYLQILVECGAIFLILFLSCLFFLIFQLKESLKLADNKNKSIIICSIVVPLAFLITQIFHSELYSYGSSFFYLVLFGGCSISYNHMDKSKIISYIWSKIER